MRFTGPNDPNLPADIRKLPAKIQESWIRLVSTHPDKAADAAIRSVREAVGIQEDWGDDDCYVSAPVEPSAHHLDKVPTLVAAMLPDDAQDIWLTSYNLCALLGCPEWKASDAGWRAVDEAGYAPADVIKYVKVREEAEPNGIPSGTVFHEAVGSVSGSVWEVVLIRAGQSANRRRYSESVLKASVPLFEGVKAYADHPTTVELAQRSGNRSVRDVVGYYSDVHWNESTRSINAKLHIFESASWLRAMLSDIVGSSAPNLIGLSINADGEQRIIREGTVLISDVVSINSVTSVDIVTEPAAGGIVVRLVASKQEVSMDPRLKKLLEGMTPEAAKNFETMWESMGEADKGVWIALAESKTVTPAPTPVPTPVAVADPVTAFDPTPLREEIDRTNAAIKEMRISQLRGYAAVKLTESKLPQAFKDSLNTRVQSLLDKRESDTTEIDAMFQESTDMWTAYEQQNSGRITGIPTPSGGEPSFSYTGYDSRDQLIAGIDGMLENKDASIGDKTIPRFHSFREAYCHWTGQSPFQIEPRKMFMESQARGFDSGVNSKLLESMTTASWGEIFSDRMYRRMVREYNLINLGDWRKIVSNIEDVPDFRTQRRERLGGYGLLPDVGEGATYQMLTSPGDEEVSYAISKRGGLEDITFEMIANDDLRNIRTIPTKLARSAAHTLHRFVMDLVRDSFSENVYDGNPFIGTVHANRGTAALSDTALSAAWSAMRAQIGYGSQDDLEVLGLRPKYLLVPPELEIPAWKLANSAVTILPANYNATEPNFFDNKLEVIVVDYWTDANNWFLVADPALVPTIEVGFFRGQEDPELFVQDQPNVGSVMTADKITYKIRHIYSGVPLDWRGFYGSEVA